MSIYEREYPVFQFGVPTRVMKRLYPEHSIEQLKEFIEEQPILYCEPVPVERTRKDLVGGSYVDINQAVLALTPILKEDGLYCTIKSTIGEDGLKALEAVQQGSSSFGIRATVIYDDLGQISEVGRFIAIDLVNQPV